MPRPRLFIGSSSAGEDVALALQRGLDKVANVTVWSQGAFGLSQGNLQALVRAATEFDFAVLVLGQDDLRIKDDQIRAVPRDNVLFELGLFIGKLGPARTFIVFDTEAPPTLPSDLAGVTAATFRGRGPRELYAAVGPAYSLISQSVLELEAIPTTPIDEHPLSRELLAIAAASGDALNLDHETFQQEIKARVVEWRDEAQTWAARKFLVRENYTAVLGGVYRRARREIFSTSVPSYLGFWHSPFGQDILKHQMNNRNARSTRVFILRSRADLTPEMDRVFTLHVQNRISVRVFFEEEPRTEASTGFMFPPELGKDWTIVDDGEVIGVTQKFGEHWEAEWYVNESKEAERFRAYKQRLVESSHAVDKV